LIRMRRALIGLMAFLLGASDAGGLA